MITGPVSNVTAGVAEIGLIKSDYPNCRRCYGKTKVAIPIILAVTGPSGSDLSGTH